VVLRVKIADNRTKTNRLPSLGPTVTTQHQHAADDTRTSFPSRRSFRLSRALLYCQLIHSYIHVFSLLVCILWPSNCPPMDYNLFMFMLLLHLTVELKIGLAYVD